MPCAIELRSKDDVQPCWLKLGEMKRISFGQRRKASPTASPRSISSTRDGSRPKVFVSISAVPTPAAPAPTTITSSVAAVADAPAPRYLYAGIVGCGSSVRSFLREARPSAASLEDGSSVDASWKARPISSSSSTLGITPAVTSSVSAGCSSAWPRVSAARATCGRFSRARSASAAAPAWSSESSKETARVTWSSTECFLLVTTGGLKALCFLDVLLGAISTRPLRSSTRLRRRCCTLAARTRRTRSAREPRSHATPLRSALQDRSRVTFRHTCSEPAGCGRRARRNVAEE